MQIPSPYEGKPFKKVEGHLGYHYTKSHPQTVIDYIPIDPDHPEKGLREEQKIIEIPDDAEVTDLRTGQSNTKYWQPEKVLDPTDCDHTFTITSVGKREIECTKCYFATSFIVGVNFFEENGKFSVKIRNHLYPVSQ